MIQAFRDTWELGIHSYLTYIRNRLIVARELLAVRGSIFVQINDENVHLVRSICDEVFGRECFIGLIAFKTATNQNAERIQRLYDYLVWYANSPNPKFYPLYRERTQEEIENTFNNVDKDGRRYKAAQLSFDGAEHSPPRGRIYDCTRSPWAPITRHSLASWEESIYASLASAVRVRLLSHGCIERCWGYPLRPASPAKHHRARPRRHPQMQTRRK
jgi:hypothetical protein